MEEIIELKNRFYILATSSLADDRTHVLQHNHTFAVFDRHGDVQPLRFNEQGMYWFGTRHLSRMELRINKERPPLLSSAVLDDNLLLTVDLTNPDIFKNGEVMISRGTLHFFRSKFLWEGVCYERILIWNYSVVPLEVSFSILLEVDFMDIFEVRGIKRKKRGQLLKTVVGENHILYSYKGLDGTVRRTTVACSPSPNKISDSELRFDAKLNPKTEATFHLTLSCGSDDSPPAPLLTFNQGVSKAKSFRRKVEANDCQVFTSNEQFNGWLNRSFNDLHMMLTKTSDGLYPFAGVPWFSTVFGRDGIIIALETLWVSPDIAKGVLTVLSSTQAKEDDPENDAEPGKIIHEMRKGEMAQLKEVPFGRYYGSVDATPLFIILAGAYYEKTGDKDHIKKIWPNIELALDWIDTYGDKDGDGFIEYARRSQTGLVQQGWKDSSDSVFHQDGSLALDPIALCEVQGYVYQAKIRAAEMASVLGHLEKAELLTRQAEELKEKFEKAFWSEELSTYVLALDAKKQPCRVRSSNAGHCLFSGIADEGKARETAKTLLGKESFSGWGIRTIASSEALYNPMSYHNGSVWPHDNALIAVGLARYGLKNLTIKLLTGLFDASLFVDQHRLPELFCGFPRRPGEGPTLYPVACSPQSWASASVFMILQSCLGLSINGSEEKVYFEHPVLPAFLQEVQINNLKVGKGSVDIVLSRYQNDVGINVTRRDDFVEVIVVK